MVERRDIEVCFSEELQLIRDSTTRDQVVTTWLVAADSGGWDNLDDAPFTLLIENSGKLTDHT